MRGEDWEEKGGRKGRGSSPEDGEERDGGHDEAQVPGETEVKKEEKKEEEEEPEQVPAF